MEKSLLWINPTEGIADFAVMENTLRELERKGVSSIVICSDRFKVDHLVSPLTEIVSIRHSKIPFLSTLIQNRRFYRAICEISKIGFPGNIMVDWRVFPAYYRASRKIKHKRGSKLILEDRSPPSGSSIKSKLQWKLYDWCWNKASKNVDFANVLVPELERFVKERFSNLGNLNFIITPSGVDTDRFRPAENSDSYPELVRIVYHGALDKGRGLSRILELKSELSEEGIRSKITIVGDGDLSPFFQNISKNDEEVVFLGRLESSELPKVVAESDYGILPLPDALEWRVGSPLKVMEFAASGLKCLTTDVKGTSPFSEESWICRADRFSPIEEWKEAVISDFSDSERVNREKVEARKYAEEKMTWEAALSDLISLVMEG